MSLIPDVRPLAIFDGELIPADSPLLPRRISGRAVADGVVDNWRTYASPGQVGGAAWFGEDALHHVERLNAGCRAFGFKIELDAAVVFGALDYLAGLNDLHSTDARLRVMVLRGDSPSRPHICYQAEPLDQAAIDEKRQRGVRAIIMPPGRVAGDSFWNMKHMSTSAAILAADHARAAGAEEAFSTNHRGELCEGTWNNLFAAFARPGGGIELLTPPIDSPCLPGVVREILLQMAAAGALGENVTAREESVPASRLADASEIFTTASISEVMPVIAVDGTQIGNGAPGPLAERIQTLLRARLAEA